MADARPEATPLSRFTVPTAVGRQLLQDAGVDQDREPDRAALLLEFVRRVVVIYDRRRQGLDETPLVHQKHKQATRIANEITKVRESLDAIESAAAEWSAGGRDVRKERRWTDAPVWALVAEAFRLPRDELPDPELARTGPFWLPVPGHVPPEDFDVVNFADELESACRSHFGLLKHLSVGLSAAVAEVVARMASDPEIEPWLDGRGKPRPKTARYVLVHQLGAVFDVFHNVVEHVADGALQGEPRKVTPIASRKAFIARLLLELADAPELGGWKVGQDSIGRILLKDVTEGPYLLSPGRPKRPPAPRELRWTELRIVMDLPPGPKRDEELRPLAELDLIGWPIVAVHL